MVTAEEIIRFLGMKPLPKEGGFYVETYRSAEKIGLEGLPERFGGARNYSTAIFYLLVEGAVSKLHRLLSDEVYHFYLGDEVTMLQLYPDCSSKIITLGSDIAGGQKLQAAVQQGIWMGCLLKGAGRFALLGTTVSPGFEFEDIESADREELLKKYPSQRKLILQLT